MSDHKRCDKCGEEYESRARYQTINLLRSGNMIVGLEVRAMLGGHPRDICDPCLDGLLETELTQRRGSP